MQKTTEFLKKICILVDSSSNTGQTFQGLIQTCVICQNATIILSVWSVMSWVFSVRAVLMQLEIRELYGLKSGELGGQALCPSRPNQFSPPSLDIFLYEGAWRTPYVHFNSLCILDILRNCAKHCIIRTVVCSTNDQQSHLFSCVFICVRYFLHS